LELIVGYKRGFFKPFFFSLFAVMIQVKKWQRLSTLILYFGFISTLFILPGSVFPKNDWLSKIWFDKWVHIGLFCALIWLCCWAFTLVTKASFLKLMIIGALYGIIVEFVQHHFIPNRYFDLGDLVADITGSLIGLLIWTRLCLKK
jgi:VanZ family protein